MNNWLKQEETALRSIRVLLLASVLCAFCMTARADEPAAAAALKFQQIFATRPGDGEHLYVLVGGGWFRGLRFGDTDAFVSRWLKQHPDARFRPISGMRVSIRNGVSSEWVYVWVEDGGESLNVDLVKAGYFPASAMADMVDQDRGFMALLEAPRLAETKASVLKERAAAPEQVPHRLVPDDDYAARVERIVAAERSAREAAAGIWSDAMREEREAQGYR